MSTRGTAARAAGLRATLAFDSAQRDATFRRSVRSERDEARENLTQLEYQQLYGSQAMDRRVELRHDATVVQKLRAWARTLESHERQRTGEMAIAVTDEAYTAALLRCALALTEAPTRAELEATVSEDWLRDSKSKGTMSYERACRRDTTNAPYTRAPRAIPTDRASTHSLHTPYTLPPSPAARSQGSRTPCSRLPTSG